MAFKPQKSNQKNGLIHIIHFMMDLTRPVEHAGHRNAFFSSIPADDSANDLVQLHVGPFSQLISAISVMKLALVGCLLGTI